MTYNVLSGALNPTQSINQSINQSWQRYCTAFDHWASAKLRGVEQRVPAILDRAAIMLGIAHISSSPISFGVTR